jgi:hypothetical protein
MRTLPGLAALAALMFATALPPQAQAQPAPPGSYRERCTDIRMNGLFLSATCRGARGGGQSSINVRSCAGDIGVDDTGALSCQGPGVGPGPGAGAGPGYPGPGYPGPGYQGRPPPVAPLPPGYDSDAIVVYSKKNWLGRSQRIDRPVANLANVGLNDAIRSIRLERRSGPWVVCEDANFRGHCDRVDRDIADTRRIGMDRAISSLRPDRRERDAY